ncbi:zinc finger CCCH domain-containing protein 13-like isoform X1 [Anopheles arabiensis]|uniref:zinc finger CCCH domain-containing protein 13-like isoform X1 n=2 Tax=Anopheles arabiensis TaxID=7173 RepID=UPI001AAD1F49|nr:zinc finger CCCH domain-containing protein 13-like isoform X1 [Anopheles arabiensis]
MAAVEQQDASARYFARPKKIPLPTNYRNAIKYVRLAIEEQRNVQELLDQDRHFRAGRTIVGRVLTNWPKIEAVYASLDLAAKEPRLNPWLAKVLISELLFGSGRLVGNSLPVECLQQYQQQVHDAHKELLEKMPAAGHVKEPRFVRINTNALDLEGAKRLLAEEQWMLVEERFADYGAFIERVKTLADAEYIEDFHFPDLLVFPNSAKSFWSRATHLHDQFLLQNKACLLPTYLLKPSKKSVVLDMCAAPGLKTTHLACLMKNRGRIYAVERSEQRYQTLCQYASAFGVIKTIHSDCLDLTDEQLPGVEFVLVDPSCSGSGMLQRQIVPEPVDQERLFKLAGLQYKLVSHAMNAFPAVRRIVYSTCSLHEEENERVVQGVLRHNGHFRLLDARKELGKEWPNVGSPDYPDVGERCLYAKTVDDLTIGMFVAVFERCPEGVQNEVYLAHEKQKESYERMHWYSDKAERALAEARGKHQRTYRTSERGEGELNGEPGADAGVVAVQHNAAKTSTTELKVPEQSVQEQGVQEANGLENVEAEVNGETKTKKKRTKKETEKEENGLENVEAEVNGETKTKEKRTKKEKEENVNEQEVEVEVEGKVEKKRIKKEKDEEENGLENVEVEVNGETKTKKKRTKKEKEEEENGLENVDAEVNGEAKTKKKRSKKETVEEENGLENVEVKVEVEGKVEKKRIKKEKVEEENELENVEAEVNGETKTKKKRTKKEKEEKATEQEDVEVVVEVEGKVEKKRIKKEKVKEDNGQPGGETAEYHVQQNVELDVEIKSEKKRKKKEKLQEQNGQHELEEPVELSVQEMGEELTEAATAKKHKKSKKRKTTEGEEPTVQQEDTETTEKVKSKKRKKVEQ